jgi:putative aldouronate transport system permease protein
MVIGKTKQDRLFYFLNYTFLVIFSIMVAYPFYYLLINSFNMRLSYGPAYLFPAETTFKYYKAIFSNDNVINAFFLSVARTALGIATALFVTSMCAFALRKRNLGFRNIYLIIFTIPMFFSGGLIPGYLNLRMLGLLDNFLVYIFPQMFVFFYVIILMSCFNDIPDSLEESAKMDGAGDFTVYSRIYMPMSLPVVAYIALVVGVGQWNSWFDTLYYTNSPKLVTLSALLIKIVRQSNVGLYTSAIISKDVERFVPNPEGIKFATMIVAIVPIVIIYPFLQRYFVKGIKIGAVKG